MNSKNIAKFFYEQCAGVTNGHMSHLPNNSVLHSLLTCISENRSSCNACTQEEFATFLRSVADELDPPKLNTAT